MTVLVLAEQSAQIDLYKAELFEVVQHFQSHPIDSDEEFQLAGQILKDVKYRLETINQRREELLEPQRLEMAKTRDRFREATAQGERAESLLKDRIAAYHRKQLEKEAEVFRAALAAPTPVEARSAIDLASRAAPIVSKVSIRETIDVEVFDLNVLPDEYVVRTPNLTKLREFGRRTNGQEQIPGVKFVTKSIVSASKRG
jgi:hypothetical protein